MKSLFFFLFLVSSIVANAQFPISPNQYDENGLRTGHWTILYNAKWQEVDEPDSVVYYRLIRFNSGKPDGKVRDFYKNGYRQWDGYLSSVNPDQVDDGEVNYYYGNGKLQYKRYILNQKVEGPYFEYSLTGQLATKGFFKNDLLDGLFLFYYNEGAVQYEIRYKEGVKHGPGVIYYPSGTIQRKFVYKNDLYDGLLEDFDAEGNLEDQSFYVLGKAQGRYQSFYADGKVKEKGFYKDDERDGLLIAYFENGKIKQQGSYKNGVRVGSWVFNYANGNIESKGDYSAGELDGGWEYYHENGLLSKKGQYVGGTQEGEWVTYYENGILKDRDIFYRGKYNGNSEEYYSNGVIKAKGVFSEGNRNGLWIYFYESGKLKAEINQKEGKRHGLCKFYFENGAVDAYQNFIQGELDGYAINFYETGTVKDSTFYTLDVKNGKYRSFFENGTPQVRATYSNGKYDGELLEYYGNGNVKSRSGYQDGVQHGLYVDYYENGKPFIQAYANKGVPEGVLIAYHKNGKKATEKVLENGEVNGPTALYDSLSDRKLAEGYFRKNKTDGAWKFFNTKGKVERLEYYIMGFKETPSNVKDSIERVMNKANYEEAISLMPWYERVVKRDAKTKAEQAEPFVLYGRIYSKAAKYTEALKFSKLYLNKIEKAEPNSTNHKTAVHNVAAAYHGLNRYAEALSMYDKAIEMERPKGLVSSYWSSVNNKVYCLYDAKREDEAKALLEDELKNAFDKYGGSSEGWYIRHEAAEYYYDRPDDYARAEELFLKLATDIHKHYDQSNSYWFTIYSRLGKIYELTGSTSLSIAYYDSLIHYSEANSKTLFPAYNEALVTVFDYYNNQSDSTRTNQLLAKLKRQTNRITNAEVLSRIYQALQSYSYRNSRYKEALDYGERAEEFIVKAGREKTNQFANILQTQAWILYMLTDSDYSLAETKFLKAVALKKENYGENDPSYFGTRLTLVDFFNSINKPEKGFELINELWSQLESDNDPKRLADANKYKAESYYGLLRYAQALPFFKKAFDLYLSGNRSDDVQRITIAGKMAACYAVTSNYAEAQRMAELAYQLAVKYYGEQHTNAYYRAGEIGYVHQYFNAYAEALPYYQKKADGYKQFYGGESEEYIRALVQVAAIYRGKGEANRAIVLLRPYEAKVDELENTTRYKILDELASDYATLNKFEEEEKIRLRLVVVSNRAESQANYALSLYSLGEMYSKNNSVEEAEQFLTQALDESKKSVYHNSVNSWIFYSSLALLKSSLEKNKEAEALLLECMAIAEADKDNNTSGYLKVAENLANFYHKMGRYTDAEKIFLSNAEYIERIEGKTFYYARMRADLVDTYYRLREFTKARAVAEELVKFVEEEFGVTHWLALNLHISLGNIAFSQNDFTRSIQEYEIALAGFNRIPKPSDIELSNKALLFSNIASSNTAMGLFKEAEAQLIECERLRKISKSAVAMSSLLASQRNWAKVYQGLNDHANAELTWNKLLRKLLQYIDDNFYYMSDQEKAQFWKSQGSNFSHYQSFAAQQVKRNPAITGGMYNVQLATKALLLSSSNKIRRRILSSGDTAIVAMYYRWQHQRNKLAQLYASPSSAKSYLVAVDSIKTKINTIEKELNIAADDQLQDKGGVRVDWKEVQQSLKPNEAAIEIIRFKYFENFERDSIVYVGLVLTSETKNAPLLVILKDGKLLENRALKFYKNSIAARTPDTFSYDAYWAPLVDAVKGKSKIYLSLDGVYNSINLNSIQTPEGNYLVDSKDFTLVSNTKDILAIKGQKLKRYARANASLVGFPTYFIGKEKIKGKLSNTRAYAEDELSDENRSGITDLPGTKVEVEKVTGLLASHQWKVTTYIDEHATESAIKALMQPRLLHIATHGFFTNDDESNATTSDPMLRAGLLFTGAANFLQDHVQLSEDNGILTAYEAANLNLDNTDLVVLSACETGKGEVQNGEGVYGLQRAFQTAGAKAIIMSLWKVDDEATQELMTSFYQNWMSGKEKADAFRQAQLQLKSKYQHPYYWGAFVMIGN